jgi:hypothetical protein
MPEGTSSSEQDVSLESRTRPWESMATIRDNKGKGYETPTLHESFSWLRPPVFSMARIARVVAPDCWHHITQRGNRRQVVFFEDADRARYLQLVALYTRRCSVRIVGYCLIRQFEEEQRRMKDT